MLKQGEIVEIFEQSKALLSGHFLLTSGLHSPNYFQCALVLQHPRFASLLGTDLARQFQGRKINAVVSPAIGGIVAGQEVARELNVRAIFAERENGVMTLRRGFSITEGENVLIVEDVLTTGKSIGEVAEVVKAQKGNIVGAGVIVDRSSGKVKLEYEVKSLMQMSVVTYAKENCPLCQQGIPLVKPGSREMKVKS